MSLSSFRSLFSQNSPPAASSPPKLFDSKQPSLLDILTSFTKIPEKEVFDQIKSRVTFFSRIDVLCQLIDILMQIPDAEEAPSQQQQPRLIKSIFRPTSLSSSSEVAYFIITCGIDTIPETILDERSSLLDKLFGHIEDPKISTRSLRYFSLLINDLITLGPSVIFSFIKSRGDVLVRLVARLDSEWVYNVLKQVLELDKTRSESSEGLDDKDRMMLISSLVNQLCQSEDLLESEGFDNCCNIIKQLASDHFKDSSCSINRQFLNRHLSLKLVQKTFTEFKHRSTNIKATQLLAYLVVMVRPQSHSSIPGARSLNTTPLVVEIVSNSSAIFRILLPHSHSQEHHKRIPCFWAPQSSLKHSTSLHTITARYSFPLSEGRSKLSTSDTSISHSSTNSIISLTTSTSPDPTSGRPTFKKDELIEPERTRRDPQDISGSGKQLFGDEMFGRQRLAQVELIESVTRNAPPKLLAAFLLDKDSMSNNTLLGFCLEAFFHYQSHSSLHSIVHQILQSLLSRPEHKAIHKSLIETYFLHENIIYYFNRFGDEDQISPNRPTSLPYLFKIANLLVQCDVVNRDLLKEHKPWREFVESKLLLLNQLEPKVSIAEIIEAAEAIITPKMEKKKENSPIEVMMDSEDQIWDVFDTFMS